MMRLIGATVATCWPTDGAWLGTNMPRSPWTADPHPRVWKRILDLSIHRVRTPRFWEVAWHVGYTFKS